MAIGIALTKLSQPGNELLLADARVNFIEPVDHQEDPPRLHLPVDPATRHDPARSGLAVAFSMRAAPVGSFPESSCRTLKRRGIAC